MNWKKMQGNDGKNVKQVGFHDFACNHQKEERKEKKRQQAKRGLHLVVLSDGSFFGWTW